MRAEHDHSDLAARIAFAQERHEIETYPTDLWPPLLGEDRTPRPGYWAARLAKNAPEIGIAILWEVTPDPYVPQNSMDRSPVVTGYINGKEVDCANWSPDHRLNTMRRRPITKAEYDWLLADRRWATAHEPESPEANPFRKIEKVKASPPTPEPRVDVRVLPPIF